METSATFKRKIAKLNREDLIELLHQTLMKQEVRRLRFERFHTSFYMKMLRIGGAEVSEIRQAIVRLEEGSVPR